MARKLRRAFFFCMMKCWLAEWLDFLFPEPIEVDMDGEPETEDWRVELPDIPEHLRAEPAEAERVVRSRRRDAMKQGTE